MRETGKVGLWPRSVRLRLAEHLICIDDRGKFVVQVGQGHRVDVFRGVMRPIRATSIERRCGIGHKVGVESQVAGHSRGSLDTVVARQSGDDQTRNAAAAEAFLEIGPDERAVHRLDNDGLTVQRMNDLLDTTPRMGNVE